MDRCASAANRNWLCRDCLSDGSRRFRKLGTDESPRLQQGISTSMVCPSALATFRCDIFYIKARLTYLTACMAFGTSRWPLEGAMLCDVGDAEGRGGGEDDPKTMRQPQSSGKKHRHR